MNLGTAVCLISLVQVQILESIVLFVGGSFLLDAILCMYVCWFTLLLLCKIDLGIIETATALVGSCMPEKPRTVVAGSTDPAMNQQVHHQITVTTSNIAAATESRFSLRRNSFRRYPPPWLLDPKRILMLFATL